MIVITKGKYYSAIGIPIIVVKNKKAAKIWLKEHGFKFDKTFDLWSNEEKRYWARYFSVGYFQLPFEEK